MDQCYDVQGATSALEKLCVASKDATNRRLADVVEDADWKDKVAVTRLEGPQTWRLITVKSAGDNTIEELVFTLAGIISAKELPPLLEKPSMASVRYRYLRQSLTITGLGTPTFTDAMKATHKIFDVFQRQFAEGQVDPWHTAISSTHECLELSNRYLTPKRDAPDMMHIPFTEDVDPHGILEDMAKAGYAHGEENEVGYYQCQNDAEGNKHFITARPQMFRIGDIVEVQLSIVVVPLKGKTYKMMTVLRSIMLLDSSFTQEAQMKRASQELVRIKPTLKRKAGYELTRTISEKRTPMDVDTNT